MDEHGFFPKGFIGLKSPSNNHNKIPLQTITIKTLKIAGIGAP
jgi:hypothetical protein